MAFEIFSEACTVAGRLTKAYILRDQAGACYAEVWPEVGFNCLRWKVKNVAGELADLIYCDPTFEQNPVPTRSGHPILFPFPNRINRGRMTWEGKEYQLPLNDASNTHAIHGFTPRNPWRVVDTGANDQSAWITGEFQLSKDLPQSLGHWPGDFIIRVTYKLSAYQLEVHAEVRNPSKTTLPFGLGYHPYFHCPNAPDSTVNDMILMTDVTKQWILNDAIPTGESIPTPTELDFRRPRPIENLNLDTLFGNAIPGQVATLGHRSALGQLAVETSNEFREFLVFTPPHRKAVALEPYTCTTDAANLQARGIVAGWQSLEPGGVWKSEVTYRWYPAR